MAASASRENNEEKRLLKKKKPLSLAFELLNERKKEKETRSDSFHRVLLA